MSQAQEKLHGVVVDNWSLELVTSALSGGALFDGIEEGLEYGNDKIAALLHILDLLVLHETLVYDTTFSWVWDVQESLRPIADLLKGVTPKETGNTVLLSPEGIPLIESGKTEFKKYKDVRKERAAHYFNLARSLGLQYWPPPKREAYVQELFSESKQSINLVLREKIESDTRQLLEDLIKPIGRLGNITMPGFGSSILKDCDNRKTILETAIEFRNSRTTMGFRKWSIEMDIAFERGDLSFISKGLSDVRDVFSDMRKEFKLEQSQNKDHLNVRIGISPSISFSDSLLPFVEHLINKRRYHMIFLRNHLRAVASTSDIKLHLKRLFNQNRA